MNSIVIVPLYTVPAHTPSDVCSKQTPILEL